MPFPTTASSFRIATLAGASILALLMSGCAATKDNQFAASAPAQANAPYALPAQAYPYPNQAYGNPTYPAPAYPNQAYANPSQPGQPFAASSWAQPPAYGQPYPSQGATPYGYAPQPQAQPQEKESYRDAYMRKQNQYK